MKSTIVFLSLAAAGLVLASPVSASLVIEGEIPPAAEQVQAVQMAHAAPHGESSRKERTASSFAKGRTALDVNFLLGVRPGEQMLVSQQGRSPGLAARIDGFGKSVRVIEALSQVVPAGWSIYTEGEVPLSLLVSWTGGRNWAAVLNSMLNELSSPSRAVEATIDWDSREMLIEARTVEIPAGTYPVQAADAGSMPAAAPNGPLFRLESGVSLSENMIAWAGQAGWRLKWLAPVDYEVSHSRIYQGEFDAEGGAVEQVISEYFDARVPLAVRLDSVGREITVYAASAR